MTSTSRIIIIAVLQKNLQNRHALLESRSRSGSNKFITDIFTLIIHQETIAL